MRFSDLQVDAIIKSSELAFDANKMPQKYKQNFLLTLRSFLTQCGMREDVCLMCMGSGKK